MKKSEIRVGLRYSDGKGRVREVIDEGRGCCLSQYQDDWDCVRYRVVAKGKGPFKVEERHSTTRASFASWAKTVVEET